MAATTATFRTRFNLPTQAPEDFLSAHLAEALKRVQRETALAEAPDGHADDWDWAVCYAAIVTALPWLHTFTLSGAAPVLRLAEGVEMRFLNRQEQEALTNAAEAEYAKRKLLIVGQPATEAPFSWRAI